MVVLRVFNVVLLIACGIGAITFIVCYAAGRQWFLSPVGRGIMAFTASVAFLAIYAVLAYFIGKPVWLQVIRIIGLFAILISTWNQVRIIVKVRYGERHSNDSRH